MKAWKEDQIIAAIRSSEIGQHNVQLTVENFNDLKALLDEKYEELWDYRFINGYEPDGSDDYYDIFGWYENSDPDTNEWRIIVKIEKED